MVGGVLADFFVFFDSFDVGVIESRIAFMLDDCFDGVEDIQRAIE